MTFLCFVCSYLHKFVAWCGINFDVSTLKMSLLVPALVATASLATANGAIMVKQGGGNLDYSLLEIRFSTSIREKPIRLKWSCNIRIVRQDIKECLCFLFSFSSLSAMWVYMHFARLSIQILLYKLHWQDRVWSNVESLLRVISFIRDVCCASQRVTFLVEKWSLNEMTF